MGRLTLCKEAKVTLCQLLILLILVAARNVVSAELTHILRNRHRQSANTLKRLEVMLSGRVLCLPPIYKNTDKS